MAGGVIKLLRSVAIWKGGGDEAIECGSNGGGRCAEKIGGQKNQRVGGRHYAGTVGHLKSESPDDSNDQQQTHELPGLRRRQRADLPDAIERGRCAAEANGTP